MQRILWPCAQALLPRFRVGLYDPPELVPWNAIPASVIESPRHHALARRAAAESFVLLKNSGGVLPFKTPTAAAGGGPRTIAVVGFSANDTASSIGRYSGHPASSTSVWDGVAAAAARVGAKAVFGGSYLPHATAAVGSADVAVVVVSGEAEGESHDRQKLGLPPKQQALLAALAATTKTPLVVCVISGGAVDVSLVQEQASAVVAMYAGGMEAGSALADLLFGFVNPSGVLAAAVYRESWANASDFLSMAMRTPPGRTHRYLTPAAVAEHVLYPFGYGLSYSAWEAAAAPRSVSISAARLRAGANVTLEVTLRNTAGPTGSRVGYAMLSRRNADADPAEAWPRQWLPVHGFAKAHGVAAGGTAVLALAITARDVSRWDAAAAAFQIRAGAFEIRLRDAAAGAPPVILTVTA